MHSEYTEKVCTQCQETKPLDAFPLDRGRRRANCRECNKAYLRDHYATNSERYKADAAIHRRNNREKISVSRKKSYAENRSAVLAKVAAYQLNNPEKRRENARRRRLREQSLPGSHSASAWRSLCASFSYRCVCCGENKPLVRDHVVPITDPLSSDDISNIQPLCQQCNSSKSNKHATDYRKTPFIRQGQVVMF